MSKVSICFHFDENYVSVNSRYITISLNILAIVFINIEKNNYLNKITLF